MPKLIEYFSFRQGFSGPHAEVADKDGGESGEETETRPPSPAAAGICVSGGLSWRGEAERQLQAHHGPVPAALPVAQPENISYRGQQIQWPRMNLGNQQMVGQLGAGRRGHTPGLCSPCRSGLILMIINSLLRNYV